MTFLDIEWTFPGVVRLAAVCLACTIKNKINYPAFLDLGFTPNSKLKSGRNFTFSHIHLWVDIKLWNYCKGRQKAFILF